VLWLYWLTRATRCVPVEPWPGWLASWSWPPSCWPLSDLSSQPPYRRSRPPGSLVPPRLPNPRAIVGPPYVMDTSTTRTSWSQTVCAVRLPITMRSSGRWPGIPASRRLQGRPTARLGGAAALVRGRPVAFAGLDPVGAAIRRPPRPAPRHGLGAVRRPSSSAMPGDHPETAPGQRGEGLGVVGRSWHESRLQDRSGSSIIGRSGLRSTPPSTSSTDVATEVVWDPSARRL